MGLLGAVFSSIFGGKSSVRSIAKSASTVGGYRVASGKSYGGGGWALDRFNSIVDAHSSVEDLVDEFELDDESCPYMSVDGYRNPYMQAYIEALEEAQEEAAAILAMLGEEVDPLDLINWFEVEEDAYEYACDLVKAWLDGSYWIPEEILDYAWYELSRHNG